MNFSNNIAYDPGLFTVVFGKIIIEVISSPSILVI